MTTLIAQVTILQKGKVGALRSFNGSGVYDAWRDANFVSPGQTFVENDATEVARLVAAGAARFQ
jgi:hypothetical protein